MLFKRFAYIALVLSLSSLLLIGCSSSDSDSSSNSAESLSRVLPLTIALNLDSFQTSTLDPNATSGIDNESGTPNSSQYHYMQAFSFIDESQGNHNVEIYYLLTDNSLRQWDIRVRVDDRFITPEDLNNSNSTLDDQRLVFTSLGELDITQSSSAGIFRYNMQRIQDFDTDILLELDYSDGASESDLGFINRTLFLRSAGDDYLVTSPAFNEPARLATQFGAFFVNPSGYIVNRYAENLRLYPVDQDGLVTNVASSGFLQALIPTNIIDAVASQNIRFAGNLPAASTAMSVDNYDPNDSITVTVDSSITIYDSLGISHTLELEFINDDAIANRWALFLKFDDTPLDITGGNTTSNNYSYAELSFDFNGQYTGSNPLSIDSVVLPLTNGASTNQSISLDFSSSSITANSAPYSITEDSQDGHTTRWVNNISLDQNGLVSIRFSDDNIAPVGRVVVASIDNVGALVEQVNSSSLFDQNGALNFGQPNEDSFSPLIVNETLADIDD
ncbi:MAG: flagellar basal body FlgE domain-containing protein [Kangiellaceae bacterium]|jgi:flagellar hook protein FlgE|nr:flagellar basal body FlgE domain-containing protein [Kangiellaceae bacterium]